MIIFFLLFYYSSAQSKSIISSLPKFPKSTAKTPVSFQLLSIHTLSEYPLPVLSSYCSLRLHHFAPPVIYVSLHHQPPQFPQTIVSEAEVFLVSLL